MTSRSKAVGEGRAMVRVRSTAGAKPATVGVCPACWNSRERRSRLIAELAEKGLAVVHPADGIDGTYRPPGAHASGCPWR